MIDFSTQDFLNYMHTEFPVCDNSPSIRELLENVTEDALLTYGTPDEFTKHLAGIIPELTENEIKQFIY